MSKKINMSLNPKSIESAIRSVKAYSKWVEAKKKELMEQLAYIGAKEATVRFGSAYFSGDKDISVTVDPIPNGYKITAKGSAVFFIEFGAGVYYNGSEPYPEPRPQGIVGIGEYGEGKGKNDYWFAPKIGFTRGTPAAMPMYHASQEMRNEIYRIAKEVFG